MMHFATRCIFLFYFIYKICMNEENFVILCTFYRPKDSKMFNKSIKQ